MREIKFRAWFHGHNKMYGPEEFMAMCGFAEFLRNKLAVPLQYTGAKDKNGKEIYEGDIVTFTDAIIEEEYTCTIIFSDYGFMLEFDDQDNNTKLCDEMLADIEIIGNVYETERGN